MAFEVIHSQTVFTGRALSVRQEQVRLPDGVVAHLEIVDHRSSVSIVPVMAGQIWFIHQYRHPTKQILLELPAGVMEDGETPLQTAAREIREEIGQAAGKLQPVGDFFLAPGYCTEYMYAFLATELYPAPLKPDIDERISVYPVAITEAYQMVEKGQIHDAHTLASLLLARPFLLTP
jgi:ADP-ribose pyrophosphatase